MTPALRAGVDDQDCNFSAATFFGCPRGYTLNW